MERSCCLDAQDFASSWKSRPFPSFPPHSGQAQLRWCQQRGVVCGQFVQGPTCTISHGDASLALRTCTDDLIYRNNSEESMMERKSLMD